MKTVTPAVIPNTATGRSAAANKAFWLAITGMNIMKHAMPAPMRLQPIAAIVLLACRNELSSLSNFLTSESDNVL